MKRQIAGSYEAQEENLIILGLSEMKHQNFCQKLAIETPEASVQQIAMTYICQKIIKQLKVDSSLSNIAEIIGQSHTH